ncbi:aminoglycoside phosphotransferase family protein [Nonomuraea sp. NPDC004580]|uniref:aminoglycoside phosphotransferase family protein n=1 Tax=Nonomuraea sp. NPDC004580 TaxID=3154552 RepID=UPI0033BA8F7A
MEISERASGGLSWVEYFRERGYTDVRRIGVGVEGVVYSLGDGRVAKVWVNGRPQTEVSRQVFADVARCPLPFATPLIHDVHEHDGVVVTYERELPGVPMRSVHEQYGRELPASHKEALIIVLRGLASVPGTEVMRRLSVQGDDRPLWEGHRRFKDALAGLVGRAVGRNGAALEGRVPDFEAGVGRVLSGLRAVADGPVSAIHGDLVPPNVHVAGDGRPVAVLDFGFFTTAGDPAFEAAVTAIIWDMYGPYAGEHSVELTELFAREFSYSADVLRVYQAVYALTTYDLFGMGAEDGHFRWCAEQLRRNPVFSGGQWRTR